MLGFAGMTMGMQTAGALGVMPGQQITGQQPPQQGNQGMQGQQSPALSVWTCSCGNKMAEDSRFCSNCGNKSLSQRITKKPGTVPAAVHPMDCSAPIAVNVDPMTENGPAAIAAMFPMETSAPVAATRTTGWRYEGVIGWPPCNTNA